MPNDTTKPYAGEGERRALIRRVLSHPSARPERQMAPAEVASWAPELRGPVKARLLLDEMVDEGWLATGTDGRYRALGRDVSWPPSRPPRR